tara:strand:- start:1726 stop:2070 length:345 start_codon:yes stop_codon:yes gene_type:complete
MQNADLAADQLEEMLDRTNAYLRAGDFLAAAGLTDATESALDDLGGLDDPKRAERLRRLAARNARSLKAAAKGIRAARRRMAEVMAAQAGLQTYDGQGQTKLIAPRPGTLRARF